MIGTAGHIPVEVCANCGATFAQHSGFGRCCPITSGSAWTPRLQSVNPSAIPEAKEIHHGE